MERKGMEKKPGGNYQICCYGMCHFLVCLFPGENKFWVIIIGKITSSRKFWGVIVEFLLRISIKI